MKSHFRNNHFACPNIVKFCSKWVWYSYCCAPCKISKWLYKRKKYYREMEWFSVFQFDTYCKDFSSLKCPHVLQSLTKIAQRHIGNSRHNTQPCKTWRLISVWLDILDWIVLILLLCVSVRQTSRHAAWTWVQIRCKYHPKLMVQGFIHSLFPTTCVLDNSVDTALAIG